VSDQERAELQAAVKHDMVEFYYGLTLIQADYIILNPNPNPNPLDLTMAMAKTMTMTMTMTMILLIQDFGQLNAVSLTKAFKKHRKEIGGRVEKNQPELASFLSTCPFWDEDHDHAEHLMLETLSLYMLAFQKEGKTMKDRRKGTMQALNFEKGDDDYSTAGHVRCGAYMGMTLTLTPTLNLIGGVASIWV